MAPIRPATIRQIFILSLIVFLGFLIAKEMTTYLSGVLGAITLYVLLYKLQRILVNRGWKPELSAVTLLIGSFITILIPISLLVLLLTSKISKAVKNSGRIVEIIQENLKNVEDYLGFDVTSSISSSEVSSWVSKNLEQFAGGTFTVFIAVGIMYFLLYFMLTNRRSLKESLLMYIPLSEENIELIAQDSTSLVKSNAIGIPVVALLQGIVALIGFFIFGVDDPFFWFAVTAVGSTIPFVGTALGIVPVCIILYAGGDVWQAIAMLIYGIVVVGATDNLFRLVIQRRLADLHPLVTLIGVIIGVPIFGFIGLIFGPIIVSLFLLVVKIYKHEYGLDKKEGDGHVL